ncbi:hypothetical protein K4L44_01785 [Halosquirtibacter laminarini]|uniref:Uncharacterized protein n=1 Tax=Halosquirtibacter laminarini TaxID=3374600 RepID=A0AC61NL70_9BACT|nr:hypothetical protein K4L44_01785 [Prolixibacteraceae bacterium]
MSVSKIDFKIGDLHFQCEGDNEWVNTQLDKVLDRVSDLLQNSNTVSSNDVDVKSNQLNVSNASGDNFNLNVSSDEGDKTTTLIGGNRSRKRGRPSKQAAIEITSTHPLVGYLERHDALDNQVRRFLATSTYLMSSGAQVLTTTLVAELIKEAGIPRLSNASDCLNKNEKKGFCEKRDKEFIITHKGVKSIKEG